MALSCVAVAQRNYVPATIITSQNDSLKGFIDFRDWFVPPKEIIFKQSLADAAEKHFGPGDINGFRIGEPDIEYAVRKVSIDITKEDFSGDKEAWDRTIQDTLVFLRKLTGGTYNLYEYVDVHTRVHYIADGKNTPVQELEKVTAFVKRSSGDGIYTDNRYQKQLADLFADNPAVAKKAASVTYHEKNLTRLFVTYNVAKDPSTAVITDERKKIKYPLSFGLMGGMSFNTYDFKGPAFKFDGPSKSNSSPIGGIWLNLPFGRVARNFSGVIELMYKQSKTSSISTTGYFSRYDFRYLQLNTMIRYTYPTKTGIKPYVNVGMGNGIAIKVAQNDLANPSRPDEWQENIPGVRKHEQSLVGGIGVTIYRLGAEIRYNSGNGFSPFVGGKTAFNSLQVLAKFSF
ncbi:PorT family protein [Chitinophaga pinensis]|uniref:PorT family protein n=1 Tax=Chitinophaga pinensis TaxID=79329 RepID=A0A5C6LUS9_9BACT|nr:PorT family protein [Chitinophaga pinensis]TWW00464.1 PorT family protein [Chitinophaga pinensis]